MLRIHKIEEGTFFSSEYTTGMQAILKQCSDSMTATVTVPKNCSGPSGNVITYNSQVTLYGRARTGVKDGKLPVGFADFGSASAAIQAAIDDCKAVGNWVRQATGKEEKAAGCKLVTDGFLRHKWNTCKSQLGGY